jgi:hypothetical protein
MKLSASALNANSLQKLADELRDYANSLPMKIEQFLNALADRGIEVARQNEGDFTGYIVYSKEFETDGSEYMLRMTAKDAQAITNSWYVSSSPNAEIRSETFSPLLMAEFGSGAYQVDNYGIGRLPDSMGHGGDEKGWYWWTDDASYRDGEIWMGTSKKTGRYRFWSKGSHPTMPIHNAVMKMIEEIDSIARSVFG